ncbi:hypothetical protein [Parabacteroides sp. Marseille-P3160]|uniref:hypothetical protein n=1 Tax=Parabacteroides sp. Marseille-P3160 TaxID=1917887 RepID=UPI0009BAF09F|nr:hypothetical protein [Parabacteroides sp. Marseille-P3160]
MHNLYKVFLPVLFGIFVISGSIYCQDDWRANMDKLNYSARYFGPNAFPYPEVQSGLNRNRWEIEARGEYHHYKGDQTKDFFARLYIPIADGKVAFEISGVIVEDYKMTPETRDERMAYALESPISCHGDAIISTYFQLLRSKKWVDILASVNLKTASGNRLVDARYTDAVSYWFDAHIGRNLYQSTDQTFSLRAQIMGGFYCWMTNNLVHRQNDALVFGGGLTGKVRAFSLNTDLIGIYGYKGNGDRPLSLRTKLEYELKKNILSIRYRHGIKDNLYDSYSIAYIRCF